MTLPETLTVNHEAAKTQIAALKVPTREQWRSARQHLHQLMALSQSRDDNEYSPIAIKIFLNAASALGLCSADGNSEMSEPVEALVRAARAYLRDTDNYAQLEQAVKAFPPTYIGSALTPVVSEQPAAQQPSDLVKRLREMTPIPTALEAADRIEALEAENKTLLECLERKEPAPTPEIIEWAEKTHMQAEIDDLRAKIEAAAAQPEREAVLVKDAERYRFLRGADNWGEDSGETSWECLGESHGSDFDKIVDERLAALVAYDTPAKPDPLRQRDSVASAGREEAK